MAKPKIRMSSSKKTLFSTVCIFYNKTGCKWRKKGGIGVSNDKTMFDMGGGKRVLKCAGFKMDQKLLTRITGVGLFSFEAHYHFSHKKEYIRQSWLGKSEVDAWRNRQSELYYIFIIYLLYKLIMMHLKKYAAYFRKESSLSRK